MTQKIVVPNRVEKETLMALGAVGEVISNDTDEPFSPATLREKCAEATALMAFMTETVDRSFLEGCPRLKVIAGALKGFDNLDVGACTDRGILVTIVPNLLTEPTSLTV